MIALVVESLLQVEYQHQRQRVVRSAGNPGQGKAQNRPLWPGSGKCHSQHKPLNVGEKKDPPKQGKHTMFRSPNKRIAIKRPGVASCAPRERRGSPTLACLQIPPHCPEPREFTVKVRPKAVAWAANPWTHVHGPHVLFDSALRLDLTGKEESPRQVFQSPFT